MPWRNPGSPRRPAGRIPAFLATAALLLPLIAGIACGPARAQDVGVVKEPSADRESVRNRSRPEYDAQGMNLGQALFGSDRRVDPATGLRLHTRVADSLILKPKMIVETEYNDNIVNSKIVDLSDVILRLKPRLELTSDWDNHQLRAALAATVQRYRTNTFEDANLLDGSLGGRIDVTEFHEIDLNVRLAQTQERLTSQDLLTTGASTLTVTSFYPIPVTTLYLDGDWDYQRDVFRSELRARVRQFDYDNVQQAANPFDRNQQDRDRWEYRLTWLAGYEAFEDTLLYVEPSVNLRRYMITPDDAGFQRDSEGWVFLTGLKYNASAVSYLDAAIGYQQQTYEDARLATLSGPTGRLSLVWNATELLTIRANIERQLTEQLLNNAGGQTRTLFTLLASQEIYYRNIATAEYRWQKDVTASNGRVAGYTQTTQNINLGLKRLFNEYASGEAYLRHSWAESPTSSLEYSGTVLGISLDLHI